MQGCTAVPIRFRLRSLLLVAAILSFCMCWLYVPTRVAKTFARNFTKYELPPAVLRKVDGAPWEDVSIKAYLRSVSLSHVVMGRRDIHINVGYLSGGQISVYVYRYRASVLGVTYVGGGDLAEIAII